MWRVRWAKNPSNRLAAIWMKAKNRNAVTAASHALDLALARDPENEGESRPNGQRVTYATPLGVKFRVNKTKRTVRVVACWQIRQV